MVWNRDTAWKQFSILSKDNLEKLGYESSLQDNSIGIVVSHSCDIANSLEVECNGLMKSDQGIEINYLSCRGFQYD